MAEREAVGLLGRLVADAGNELGRPIDGSLQHRERERIATVTIDPEAVDPVEAIRERTDGGPDVPVDALGIAETCRNSVRCLRGRGTHAQVGLTTDAERGEIGLPTDWMTRWEITFVGLRGMSPTSYDDLFDLVVAADIDPGNLVARELAFGAVSERLAAMGAFDIDGVEIVTSF